jgi:hypothetical protein
MPTREQGRLRVYSEGAIRLSEARRCLGAIEHAYNSVLVFETAIDKLERAERTIRRYYKGFPISELPYLPLAWLWHFGFLLPGRAQQAGVFTREEIATVVPVHSRLLLAAARLESPGFWEFLGSLNPLEVLRQYLSDRHERRKDREYREAAEARRLSVC